jgi:hypothetical protein
MTKNVTEVKLGGAKRKNGHKSDCSCHICENMKNKAKRGGYEEEAEKEEENQLGGSKKKNGHRKNCDCPICKNMKKSKKGGDDDYEDEEDIDSNDDEDSSSDEEDSSSDEEDMNEEPDEVDKNGGNKKKNKKNGHKVNCKCPICKNMRKGKSGGDEPDIENQMGDIEEGGIKSDPSLTSDETVASSDEYDALDSAERGEAGSNVVGGTRKYRRNKKIGGKSKKAKKAKKTKKNKKTKKTKKARRSRRHH